MQKMNKIVISGRIVREADLQNKGDVTLAKTAIASDRSRKGTKTDFIEVAAFGDAAGQLAELAKGEFVRITGSLKIDSYDDTRNGVRRKAAQVVVRKIERFAQEAAAA
jgi:single-stranded DNA-binding protein